MKLNRLWGGLRVRLVLLTLLALLPLGLIALWQTFQAVDDARDLAERSLVNATQAEAIEQRARVKGAIGAGQALGAVVRATDLSSCRQAMARFLENDPNFVFAGFVDTDGIMACSSAGDQTLDFSGYESLQEALDQESVYIEINANGAVSQQHVMIVSVPVFEDGELLGLVSLSLPMQTIFLIDDSEDTMTLFGISTSGTLFPLSASADRTEAYMAREISVRDMIDRAGTSFVAEDQSGDTRVFSVTDLIADSYLIVGSWQQGDLVAKGAWRLALLPVLFAILMWAASMAVSLLGLTRLVLRPLADLRSAMRKFAVGERTSVGLDLGNAPEEFKDAERAFNRMALLITEAEAEQLTNLHDKEVLLREVHHRVKNNLQMIASIMNLQARNAHTQEARDVLAGLQRRVRGLAMLHRSLYAEAATTRVDSEELVAAVVSDTGAVTSDASMRIDTELVSAMLYPDQAVPLSMWTAEALTNAVKYAKPDASGVAVIRVTMELEEGGALVLTVSNTADAGEVDSDLESTGLGTKLMTAFCRQLEGTDAVIQDDGRYTHVLRFQIQGFTAEPDDVGADDTPADPRPVHA